MMDNLEVRGWLRQATKNTADWRRRTAEQYPDDNRNIEAAEELERLAGTVDDIPEALLRQYAEGSENESASFSLSEIESECLRRIGFSDSWASAAKLVEHLCDKIADLKADVEADELAES
jgi:HAMP domain-containing protein